MPLLRRDINKKINLLTRPASPAGVYVKNKEIFMQYCGTSKEQRMETALLILKQPTLDFSFISFYFGSSVLAALLFSWLEVNGLAEKEPGGPWTFYVYKIRQYLKQEASEEEIKQYQQKVNKAWQQRNLGAYFTGPKNAANGGADMPLHWLAFWTSFFIGLYLCFIWAVDLLHPQGLFLAFCAGVLALFITLLVVFTKYDGDTLLLYMGYCLLWCMLTVPVLCMGCFLIFSNLQMRP